MLENPPQRAPDASPRRIDDADLDKKAARRIRDRQRIAARPVERAKAIWLSENVDAFMAPSPDPVQIQTQNWKILTQTGPASWGQVTRQATANKRTWKRSAVTREPADQGLKPAY